MKNTLQDLNNHLFAQLERLSDEDLSDEDLSDEKLNTEINRARAMVDVASKILENANISVEVAKLIGKEVLKKEDTKSILGYKHE